MGEEVTQIAATVLDETFRANIFLRGAPFLCDGGNPPREHDNPESVEALGIINEAMAVILQDPRVDNQTTLKLASDKVFRKLYESFPDKPALQGYLPSDLNQGPIGAYGMDNIWYFNFSPDFIQLARKYKPHWFVDYDPAKQAESERNSISDITGKAIDAAFSEEFKLIFPNFKREDFPAEITIKHDEEALEVINEAVAIVLKDARINDPETLYKAVDAVFIALIIALKNEKPGLMHYMPPNNDTKTIGRKYNGYFDFGVDFMKLVTKLRPHWLEDIYWSP